ncbi:hypothetical protein J2P12_03370 [Candidatus Bathyarchaeota archaeon]|nr:hypothetical protein [Candidatus Bathyarchaeota archaeon]
MEQSAKPPEAPKPKNRTMLLAVIIVAILVVVGVGAYILLQKPTTTTADYTITIYDNGCSSSTQCGFKDSSGSPNITISVGKTVQWKNTGALPHTATSCDSSHASSAGCPVMDASSLPSFDTGTLSNGQTSSLVTFSQAGTYYYYCTVHPSFMHGVIIVQ